MIKSKLLRSSIATASLLLAASTSQAIALIDGMSGETTYGDLALPKNDDGSSSNLTLPFELNFYGTKYNSLFVNNNGNVTFNSSVGSFTPTAFPNSSQPMIAPFWGDVDTSCESCGNVYIGSPNDETVVVTWNDVGYFPSESSKTNNFQLVLRDQGSGDFDIEFRYDRLEWTTGGASGGVDGLGGTPAQAGFDAGDQTNFFTLPGSRTADVLELQNTTNVAAGEAGLWSFAIKSGVTPGASATNPLLPVLVDGSFEFDFNIQLNQTIFIDPDVAVGYDYVVESGPNIASVILPTGFGDDIYQLYVGSTLLGDAFGGVEYFFDAAGVDSFRVMGIEESLSVDPTDISAFVTGLTFVDAGLVSMSQTPVTVFVADSGQVPVPAPWLLMFGGALVALRQKSIR